MARIRHQEPDVPHTYLNGSVRVNYWAMENGVGKIVRTAGPRPKNKTDLVFSPGRTVAASLLATALASGAGSTVEALGHELPDIAPIINHVPFDTRHIAIEKGDEQQERRDIIANIPIGSQPDGIDTYSFPIDLSDAQLHEPSETHEIIEPIAIGTINRIEAGMSLAETRNALNDALEANDIDINVDSLIANADQIVLDGEQKAQLQSIADQFGYGDIQTLIADYGAGAIRESDPNRAALDELLQTNDNTTIDMKLETAEHGDMLATIYITDEGYTIVANQYEHSENRGVLLTLVVIPVVVPLGRRRTRDEQIMHDYNKDEKAKSKAYKKYKKAQDKELQKYIQEEEQRRKEALVAYEVELAKLRADITASLADAQTRPARPISQVEKDQIGSSTMFVSSTRLMRGAGVGGGVNKRGDAAPVVEEKTETEAKTEPAKKRTVIVAIPDASTNESDVPESKKTTRKPVAAESPSDIASSDKSDEPTNTKPESEKEDKEKKERKKRVLPRRIAKLIIISSLVAELLSGDSADPERGQGVPEGTDTVDIGKELGKIRDDYQEEDESENENGTGTNGTGEGDGSVVIESTPETGALILTYRDGELTAATLTGDVQNDLLVTERQTPPEEPSIEEIRTHYNWIIPSGGTGEGLMATLGVAPSRWYEIGPELIANFPGVFYGDVRAPRIANAGELPDPVKDYLIAALGLE